VKADPVQQHEWLRQLVGEWTFEHDAPAAPGGMPEKHTGTESVRMLGDLWAICEGHSQMPDGSPATTVMTLGYDPAKGRFVGTFIGSMMTHLWLYDGELDGDGRALKLAAEGPSFSNPQEFAQYVDTIEMVSNDERILTSKALQPDGTWTEFMRASYRRTKA
jgi:hypothetical protein